MNTKKLSWLVFLVILLGLPGCQGAKVKGLVPVQGTVTYKGEPLEGATVGFTPKEFNNGDRLGTGMTDAQGKFELRTIGELGVLPNDYLVIVIKNELIPEKQSNQQQKINPKTGKPFPVRPSPPKVKSLIPTRYNAAKTSGLSFTVGKEGLKDIKIEIVD